VQLRQSCSLQKLVQQDAVFNSKLYSILKLYFSISPLVGSSSPSFATSLTRTSLASSSSSEAKVNARTSALAQGCSQAKQQSSRSAEINAEEGASAPT
jgi:hypothetical protein